MRFLLLVVVVVFVVPSCWCRACGTFLLEHLSHLALTSSHSYLCFCTLRSNLSNNEVLVGPAASLPMGANFCGVCTPLSRVNDNSYYFNTYYIIYCTIGSPSSSLDY